MKILVTGASGLLGANIALALKKGSYEVRILTRKNSTVSILKDADFELVYGDITNYKEVQAAMTGCDAVIHSASLTSPEPTAFEAYEEVNVKGTMHMVNAALAVGVKRFIYISTANTIGAGTIQNPGTELSAFNLFHVGSGYVNSKYLAQQYVLEQVERKALPAVILNPTFMIGAYDYKPSSGEIILRAFKQWIQFFPSSGKNFVHVKDVARVAINALHLGKIGQCYLVANENLTYKDFFNKVNRIASRSAIQISLPSTLLNGLGLLGSLWNKMGIRQTTLNYANTQLLNLHNYYSGKKAEREFQITYTPIDEAIKDAVDWFSQNGYIRRDKEISGMKRKKFQAIPS